MKNTKRFLAILLTMMLVFTCIPFAFAEDVTIVDSGICGAEGDNATWTLDSEGTLTIEGEGALNGGAFDALRGDDIETFPYIEGSPVKKAVVSDKITDIDCAFYRFSEMESIILPESLDATYFSFEYCVSLKSIIIPEGVANFNFTGCFSLESVSIPESVTEIEDGAFWGCFSLEHIELPNGLKRIGYDTFRYCGIKSIKIPASVDFIGLQAFENAYLLYEITVDENNQYFSSLDGCLYNKDQSTLIKYPESKRDETYDIPSNTRVIFDWAFYGNDYLKEMILPITIESVGAGAFSACVNLQNIYILNPNCMLNNVSNSIVSSNTTIHGYENSTAERHALVTNRKFVTITDETPPEETATQSATEPTSEPTTEPATQPEPQKEETPQNFFQKISAFFRNLFDRLFSIFRR